MTDSLAPDVTLDQRGAGCPGPLMKLVGAMRDADAGTVVELRTSDDGSKDDVPEWLEKAGHELLAVEEHEDYWSIYAEKS